MQKNQASPPNTQSLPVQRKAGIGRVSESKEHNLKHICKYHNYYHSHRKSAEKVTWHITQIGNSAGCLSWQWTVRGTKDDWKVISCMILFYFNFSIARMLYLELWGLVGEKKWMSSQDCRDEMLNIKED